MQAILRLFDQIFNLKPLKNHRTTICEVVLFVLGFYQFLAAWASQHPNFPVQWPQIPMEWFTTVNGLITAKGLQYAKEH